MEYQISHNLDSLYQEHLDKGNVLRFKVRGGSMHPLIQSGDIVYIYPTDKYRIGDILLCKTGNNWIVHRLVCRIWNLKGRRLLILKGDALNNFDSPVLYESILGCVKQIERKGELFNINNTLNISNIILFYISFLSVFVCNKILTGK